MLSALLEVTFMCIEEVSFGLPAQLRTHLLPLDEQNTDTCLHIRSSAHLVGSPQCQTVPVV